MRKLFKQRASAVDTKSPLFSVISLMMLLSPFLLLTSSPVKLTALTLGLPGSSTELPPEMPGAIEQLTVIQQPGGYQIAADVRKTDVLAAAGQTERKEVSVADLAGLQAALATFKALDPKRERISLRPLPTTRTADLVAWMDAVRNGPQGPLFSSVILDAGP